MKPTNQVRKTAHPPVSYGLTGLVIALLTINLTACFELDQVSFVPLQADFAVSSSVIQLGDSVAFFQGSTIVADQFLWDFGDSTTSTEANPIHFYQTIGRYTVKLTSTKADGITKDSLTQQVVVLPPTTPVSTTTTFGEAQREEFGLCFTNYEFEGDSVNTGFLLAGRRGLNTLLLIRTDENYNVIWEEEYDNIAAGRGELFPQTVIPTVETDATGAVVFQGFVIVGFFRYNAQERDAFIIKVNSQGEEIWVDVVNTNRDEAYVSVVEENEGYTVGGTIAARTGDGNFTPQVAIDFYSREGEQEAVTTQGRSWVANDFQFRDGGGYTLAITKGGRPGIVTFTSSLEGDDEVDLISNSGRPFFGRALGVNQLEKGDFLIVGERTYPNDSPDSTTSFLAKVNELGRQIWIVDTLGFYFESLYDVVTDDAGNIFGVGVHENPLTGKDIIMVKYGNKGGFTEVKLIGGKKDEEAFQLLYVNGKIHVFGTTKSFGNGLRDFYLFNIDSNFTEIQSGIR